MDDERLEQIIRELREKRKAGSPDMNASNSSDLVTSFDVADNTPSIGKEPAELENMLDALDMEENPFVKHPASDIDLPTVDAVEDIMPEVEPVPENVPMGLRYLDEQGNIVYEIAPDAAFFTDENGNNIYETIVGGVDYYDEEGNIFHGTDPDVMSTLYCETFPYVAVASASGVYLDGTEEATIDFISAQENSGDPDFIAPEGFDAVDVDYTEATKKFSFAKFFSNKRNLILTACGAVALVGICIAVGVLLFGKSKPVEETVDEPDNEIVEEVVEDELTSEAILLLTTDAGKTYTDNTLFMGDSNTVRLSYMNVLTLDQTAGIVGVGIEEIDTKNDVYFNELSNPVSILKATEYMGSGRIIMNFGTNNTTNMKVNEFIAHYKEAIKKVKKIIPDADIIVASIFPVAKDNSYNVKQSDIDAMNAALLKMCEELDIPFLNVQEDLKNPVTGYVRDSYISSDGIHLSQDGLATYVKYARTHTHTGGPERKANTRSYTRKESPYTYFKADKEEPLNMVQVVDGVTQLCRNAGYSIAETNKSYDEERYLKSTVSYTVSAGDNKAGNEQDVAGAAFYKLKELKDSSALYVKVSYAANSSDDTVAVYIILIKCNHKYNEGVCEYCKAEDPDYKPEEQESESKPETPEQPENQQPENQQQGNQQEENQQQGNQQEENQQQENQQQGNQQEENQQPENQQPVTPPVTPPDDTPPDSTPSEISEE